MLNSKLVGAVKISVAAVATAKSPFAPSSITISPIVLYELGKVHVLIASVGAVIPTLARSTKVKQKKGSKKFVLIFWLCRAHANLCK